MSNIDRYVICYIAVVVTTDIDGGGIWPFVGVQVMALVLFAFWQLMLWSWGHKK